MAKTVKILDCTLRDGGYIINWNFGKEGIISILDYLSSAGIDYAEAGFLKEFDVNDDISFLICCT